MKEFKTYYRDKNGEVIEHMIAASSKTAAKKAATLYAKQYDLRFIGFPEDFGL